MFNRLRVLSGLAIVIVSISTGYAQEKSVKPGVNDAFRDPDVQEFLGKFEVESREVYSHRKEVVAACRLQPGQTVADIGAGTGLFTRLFSKAVGKEGRVIAVDISQNFLDHIQQTSRKAGLQNVETVLCTDDSTELPPNSIDVAFICDVYHHFEFPLRTMGSLHRALKPGGRVILIDFHRIPGTSSDWTLSHVRAGQEVFESEMVQAGFHKTRQIDDLLKDNYFVEFTKGPPVGLKPFLFPIIADFGEIVKVPDAAEKPRAGAKIVFDITTKARPADINKGLVRAARLLNLYGAAGLKSSDINIVVVLHGEATKSVLRNEFYQLRYRVNKNPNLPLIKALTQAGVEVFVCGQALNYQGYPESTVTKEVPIADAAMTVIVNRQMDGYGYLPVH